MLSEAEAGRLENWGLWPCCKAHHHVKKNKAAAMVASDTHRYVGGKDTAVDSPTTMIVELNNSRPWKPVQAHMPDGRPVIGFKVWGLPRTL